MKGTCPDCPYRLATEGDDPMRAPQGFAADGDPPYGDDSGPERLATEGECALNTDRELWRKGDGDGNGMSYYEPSIHVTQGGDIGINVGGTVYVLPVEKWHRLAAESYSSGKIAYDED